jgi:hypothetical protein
MKTRIAGFICILGLIGMSMQSQQPHSEEPTHSGRYQAIPAVVDAGTGTGGETTHELFLVDTQSGRVWRFQAEGIGKDSNGKAIEVAPEGFFPIPFYGADATKQLTPQK